MDNNRFDRLSRQVGSRRSVGLALAATTLLGLAEAATAKKKKRRCKKIRKGPRCDGTTCDGFSVKTCHSKKFGRCRCREGTTCLPNTSCGLNCTPECPDDCVCAFGLIEGGESHVCVTLFGGCENIPTPCETTTDCPRGTICISVQCMDGSRKRCAPLCNTLT